MYWLCYDKQFCSYKSCAFAYFITISGFLDPSATEDDLKAGTNVEIPLWLAESLHSRRPPLVNVDLPRIYKEAYREILNADACTIDMHKLGQYFYELGCFIAKHDIKGEVASTLVNVSSTIFIKCTNLNKECPYLASCKYYSNILNYDDSKAVAGAAEQPKHCLGCSAAHVTCLVSTS